MEVYRRSSGLLLLLGLFLLAATLQGVQGEVESEGPSESECRPYIEKALKELETGESAGESSETGESNEDIPTVEVTDDSDHQDGEGDNDSNEGQENTESVEEEVAEQLPEPETAKKHDEAATEDKSSKSKVEDASQTRVDDNDNKSDDSENDKESKEDETESAEKQAGDDSSKGKGYEEVEQVSSIEENDATTEDKADTDEDGDSGQAEQEESKEDQKESIEATEPVEQVESAEQQQEGQASAEEQPESEEEHIESKETQEDQVESKEEQAESKEQEDEQAESNEDQVESKEEQAESKEEVESEDEQGESPDTAEAEEEQADSVEEQENKQESTEEIEGEAEQSKEDTAASIEKESYSKETEYLKDNLLADKPEESDEDDKKESADTDEDKDGSKEDATDDTKEETSGEAKTEKDDIEETDAVGSSEEYGGKKDDESGDKSDESGESGPVEDLSLDVEIPSELRSRDHVEQLLKLDDRSSDTENIFNKVSEITLKELKKLYENAIKPLEVLYRYRDLSNRHFGDAEIFSKPLILFMGPWSGGKSSIINYLVNNEYNETSLRTGAEPSPAYFNILMHGDEPEIIDGTELAADFTFSGLQKFGQGLEERLRGVKLPTKLLEKVNIVEIPGILEVRKQVSRVFPFNDACQWFIDRADIIFLVYDPSKLDVGPETEAILDQLKGREHQTRIVLNKADQVKPEELMRVQGALIWNISPLMSSPQPPIMYTASLWSRPYESWAPIRLLQAQERAFLRDIRSAIDKRIDNKIASARRFAVRVRNHAKMVDCYLTTYYNHKSVFGNRKQVADEIIEHPQDYHIYEGLSTLTNISRYDLPDPDVYRDFFKLNPLYEFQQLSATCTYFRGCPINRLDVAIAYDLPELVGTHKKLIESALADGASPSTSAPGS